MVNISYNSQQSGPTPPGRNYLKMEKCICVDLFSAVDHFIFRATVSVQGSDEREGRMNYNTDLHLKISHVSFYI